MLMEVLIRAAIVFVSLVLGAAHIRGLFERYKEEKYSNVGSQAMLSLMWVFIMAKAIMF